MRIEELKRWHWILVGLIVGITLGYLYGSIEPGSGRSISQARFEAALNRTPLQGSYPWIRDIVVHPHPEHGVVITGLFLEPGRGDTMLYQPFQLVPPIPYEPLSSPRGNRPANWEQSRRTARDYLDHMARTHDHVAYRYAWTSQPLYRYLIWTAGTVLVIGIVWPSIISLLTGGGLGRRGAAEPEYDLSRFQSGPASPQGLSMAMTQEGADQLASLEAELERKLASRADDAMLPDSTPESAPEQPIRELNAPPPEDAPVESPQEKKDYAGEFYPTVAHAPPKKPVK
jgi:uncharacterized membrane-anchored protein YhcB (DUF1043 family)